LGTCTYTLSTFIPWNLVLVLCCSTYGINGNATIITFIYVPGTIQYKYRVHITT